MVVFWPRDSLNLARWMAIGNGFGNLPVRVKPSERYCAQAISKMVNKPASGLHTTGEERYTKSPYLALKIIKYNISQKIRPFLWYNNNAEGAVAIAFTLIENC